jgi:hypothetical protein
MPTVISMIAVYTNLYAGWQAFLAEEYVADQMTI